jgi:acetyl esterase/lipase
MKKSVLSFLSNGINSATMAASSSNAGNILMAGGRGIPRLREKPPVAPFTSEMIQIGGAQCCLHKWETRQTPKALVIYFHGANTHGSFPTNRLVANLLVNAGYAFVSPDLPGHGRYVFNACALLLF